MRGADQIPPVNQELARRKVEAAPLMRADVTPGENPVTVTMDDDSFKFTTNLHFFADDLAIWQVRTPD